MTEDAENKGDPIYNHWIKELDAEEKAHKDFRKEGDRVYERYRDEQEKKKGKFNILWSNTRVQHSAVLSSRPKPDVTRRYKDPDQLSRDIAEVTERAISYSLDMYDSDGNFNLAVDDYLLPGLGQIRARYTPYFGKGEPPRIPVAGEQQEDGTVKFIHEDKEVTPEIDELGQPFVLGEPPDVVVYEEVTCEVVPWKNFRWMPANSWESVNWCAIEHYLTKEELTEQFGQEKADQCPLGYTEEGAKTDKEQDGKSRAKVYEIFDKKKRELVFICDGYNQPLGKESDPLNLQGFYPFPKPMMTNVLSDKCIPSPDFIKYEEQADELDQVTARIRALTKELKWNGMYDGSFKELEGLGGQGDGVFLPVDGWSERFQGSPPALENAIITRPIDKLILVIRELYASREGAKQTIYEITGIADIIRGATNASETLGAQQLKQQNASLGLTPKQNEVARFFRDIYRIKAEIIVEQFQPQTLTLMTGIQVTPEMMAIMKNDLLRSYKIDIETDSTVATDQSQEQQNVVELLTAITSFIQQFAPLVQMGIPPEIGKEMLLFAVRRFKGGDQLEQVLEKLGDGAQVGGMIGGPGAAPVNPAMGVPPPPM
jgi:hypothetical protein